MTRRRRHPRWAILVISLGSGLGACTTFLPSTDRADGGIDGGVADVMDVVRPPDAPPLDRTPPDDTAPPPDVALDTGADTGNDVPAKIDTGSPDPPPPDGGLQLRSRGFSSLGESGSGEGGLRLIHLGFEEGEQQCVGSLCLSGGLTP